MSKVVNLEIVNIFDDAAELETDNGFTFEMDLESLPENIKVGQSVKCVMSLNTVIPKSKEFYKPKERIVNGRNLTY